MRDPVVFLPGLMCDARVFAPQINALSRDHVVISAPLVGHGRLEDIVIDLLPQLPP